LSILYAKPEANPVKLMFEFLSPLHLYTWLALIGSVLVSALVLAVLHQLSRNEHSFSLYETVFISFASLIQGLTGVTPNRPSAQLVTAVYWLFAFVILVAYVTNYAAKRTLERVQSEITDLDSLPVQETYEYGTFFGSVYLSLLKGSNDPVQQAAFSYISNNPERRQPRSVSQALSMVSGGKFALIYNSVMNDYNAKMTCNFHVAGNFGLDSAMLGLPESAEYDDLINRIINHLVATGERDRLFEKYFNPPKSELPNCTDKPFPYALNNWIPQEPNIFNTRHGALTLSNTLGIAVINLAGCLLTLLLALLEKACINLRPRLNQLKGNALKDWRRHRAGTGEAVQTAAKNQTEEMIESYA
uniref:PBPe domain-containing protein n=1 Tax=Macrostomum lignano TaxID=282301 RepID=A0A1I8J5F7_9PLAT